MFKGLRTIGMIALGASILMLTACGDVDSDNEGEFLVDTLLPEAQQPNLEADQITPRADVVVTRAGEISERDAQTIAAVYLDNIYLPDEPVPEGIEHVKDFSPNVRVTGLPEVEEAQIRPYQNLFSAQGYLCKPREESSFRQYIDVICVRADSEQEQQ